MAATDAELEQFHQALIDATQQIDVHEMADWASHEVAERLFAPGKCVTEITLGALLSAVEETRQARIAGSHR